MVKCNLAVRGTTEEEQHRRFSEDTPLPPRCLLLFLFSLWSFMSLCGVSGDYELKKKKKKDPGWQSSLQMLRVGLFVFFFLSEKTSLSALWSLVPLYGRHTTLTLMTVHSIYSPPPPSSFLSLYNCIRSSVNSRRGSQRAESRCHPCSLDVFSTTTCHTDVKGVLSTHRNTKVTDNDNNLYKRLERLCHHHYLNTNE